ncbi:hypothetical protein HHI36_017935 [Cryptolaemus montrouzieri]|uniref:Uncharacterized protein n=1 Tax=Cryptolaemus montrouzieri TaxID=559131 RepID=A0ABD2NYQ1_9CUCU
MSSNRNKLNFRQNSLICDSPKIEIRRNSLRKQSSEDISIQRNKILNNEMKVIVNNKCKNDFPKPKLAWGEPESKDAQQPIIGKRCQENLRPKKPISKQNSIGQDSILSCKEDLIDKIRLLLKDEKEIPEKQNISIFLAPNTTTESRENATLKQEETLLKPIKIEEKLCDEGPTLRFSSDSVSTKSLFQFRKSESLEERRYFPSTFEETRREPPNILVTPLIETSADIMNGQKNQTKNVITNISQPIHNIIIRPNTAASRRDVFKKRTNSAFQSIIKEVNSQRAPLQRSSSAPIRPDHSKSKFLATKRKLKSTRKKDIRSAKRGSCDRNDANEKESQEIQKSSTSNGAEIVTMVSLVSPAASDVEEIPEIEKESTKITIKNHSPRKASPITRREENVPKISALRKVAKQVSFQQSSIHAIRSFSAGFPGRKNSMVTSLMLNGGNSYRTNTLHKIQERRVNNVTVPEDDGRVPKRRLIRSQSAHPQILRYEEKAETDRSITPLPEDPPTKISVDIAMRVSEEIEEAIETEEISKDTLAKSNELENIDVKPDVENNQGEDQKFCSSNEKECWKLFLKMNNKGVKVNYDTLLRGMLTPTEYRKRRLSLAAAESLTKDTDNTMENQPCTS